MKVDIKEFVGSFKVVKEYLAGDNFTGYVKIDADGSIIGSSDNLWVKKRFPFSGVGFDAVVDLERLTHLYFMDGEFEVYLDGNSLVIQNHKHKIKTNCLGTFTQDIFEKPKETKKTELIVLPELGFMTGTMDGDIGVIFYNGIYVVDTLNNVIYLYDLNPLVEGVISRHIFNRSTQFYCGDFVHIRNSDLEIMSPFLNIPIKKELINEYKNLFAMTGRKITVAMEEFMRNLDAVKAFLDSSWKVELPNSLVNTFELKAANKDLEFLAVLKDDSRLHLSQQLLESTDPFSMTLNPTFFKVMKTLPKFNTVTINYGVNSSGTDFPVIFSQGDPRLKVFVADV